MSEQLAFDQRVRYGSAVECDERLRGTPALLVYVRGDQLFPRPAGSLYQNRRFGRCDFCGDFKDFPEHLALPDHLEWSLQTVDRPFHDEVVDEELPPFERALYRPEKFVGRRRLGDIIVSSEPHAFNRDLDIAHPCQHHNLDSREICLDETEQFHSVHLGHLHVTEDHVIQLGLDRIDCGHPVHRGVDGESGTRQEGGEHVAECLFIVDDEY